MRLYIDIDLSPFHSEIFVHIFTQKGSNLQRFLYIHYTLYNEVLESRISIASITAFQWQCREKSPHVMIGLPTSPLTSHLSSEFCNNNSVPQSTLRTSAFRLGNLIIAFSFSSSTLTFYILLSYTTTNTEHLSFLSSPYLI